jgi:hypothetical protein
MKILKWVMLTLLLAGCLAGMGLFVFIKTFDINQYKDKLAREMGFLIGRDVSVENLGLEMSLTHGVVLKVKGLRFQDDPRFSKQVFLQADHVRLGMNVVAFFWERKILASHIQIYSPIIRVVRSKDGSLNIPLGFPAAQAADARETSTFPDGSSSRGESVSSAHDAVKQIQFSVETIHLQDGKFFFSDLERSAPVELSMERLNLHVQGFSSRDSFNFALDGAVFGQETNLHVQGQARLDPVLGQARLDDVTMSAQLDKMMVPHIRQSFFQGQEIELGNAWKGTLSVGVSQMVIGPEGLLLLALEGGLEGGEIIFSQLSLPLEDIQMKYEMSEHDVRLSQFTVDMGGGRLSLSGNVDDYPQRQKFAFHFQVENISLEELTKTMNSPVKLGGWIQGEGHLSGRGFGKRFIPYLEGEGRMTLTQGRLRGVNLLQMIFSAGGQWRALIPHLEEHLPDAIKERMGRQDTFFKNIHVRLTAGDSLIRVPEILMETDDVVMKAQGQFDWDFHSEVESTAVIAPELSSGMAEGMEIFEPLFDEERRIRIPMEKHEGLLWDFRPNPDGKYIARKMADILGRQKLLELVDKSLERNSRGDQIGRGKTRDGQSPAEREGKPSTRALLEKLLEPQSPDSQGESSRNDDRDGTSTKEEDFIDDLFETLTIEHEKE